MRPGGPGIFLVILHNLPHLTPIHSPGQTFPGCSWKCWHPALPAVAALLGKFGWAGFGGSWEQGVLAQNMLSSQVPCLWREKSQHWLAEGLDPAQLNLQENSGTHWGITLISVQVSFKPPSTLPQGPVKRGKKQNQNLLAFYEPSENKHIVYAIALKTRSISSPSSEPCK